MTVNTATTRATHAGDGATTAFSTAFTFAEDSEVVVTSVVDATGTETQWVLGTEYTLVGAATGVAGTITAVTSPTDYTPATGETLVVALRPDFTQLTALPRGGTVSPKDTLEEMHDKRVRQILRLKDATDRSLKLSITESTIGTLPPLAQRAGAYFAFDENGDPIAVTSIETGTTPVSIYMGTMFLAADASEALAILQIAGIDNLVATGPPTANDDTTLGYSVGSRWVDITNDVIYLSVDDTDGAAIWQQVATEATVGDSAFPTGTAMLFRQTAAPTYWTKVTTSVDNKALRVTSGTVTDAGATGFTTVFGSGKTSGATTLSTSQIPTHTHSVGSYSAAAGGSHSHTISANGATLYADQASSGLWASGDRSVGDFNDSAGTQAVVAASVTDHTHTVSGTSGGSSGSPGGSHTHTLSLDLAYIDIIIATKDA